MFWKKRISEEFFYGITVVSNFCYTVPMRPNALVLIVHNDKVLLGKGFDSSTNLAFYRPLGGGIEFGEYSVQTAKREIQEEIGLTLCNEKLVTVFENIFKYEGKLGHEITFLYKGDILEADAYQKDSIPRLDKENTFAEWVSITDVQTKKIVVFPETVIDYV
jgi:8-oxo-dGTP pyrophosphatase MutT (NUDIX family)